MFKKLFKNSKSKIQKEDISQIIFDLIRKLLPDDMKNVKLDDNTKFEDIGFNSIMFMNFIFSLEDVLNLDIEKIVEKVDITEITTIGDALEILEKI